MRLLLVLMFSIFSLSSFANCYEKVDKAHTEFNEERGYAYPSLGEQTYSIEEVESKWQTTINFDAEGAEILVYLGSSEFWGGYGVDAIIVDANSCEIVAVEEVYAE